MGFIIIHPEDTVRVSLEDGHKYALRDLSRGEQVIKYGHPIGVASADIRQGEHVHSHNLKTALSGSVDYTYAPRCAARAAEKAPKISAYVRENGEIGIRNDIWIVNTVGCVNKIAERLARETGALAFPHPYGCSQLGGDHLRTQRILCGLIGHPNAGGVLVLGLGCENNHIAALKNVLGAYDEKRVQFLNVQECGDEIGEGIRIIRALQAQAAEDQRAEAAASKLKIGLKCGGSDGLSGITANPLVGRVIDRFTAMGATAVLTETPEMFGAEQLLMNRCVSRELFAKTVRLIQDSKAYFTAHHQPVSENPSPGNRAGGITTLEEKSLGCVQKGGGAPVTDVLDYGCTAKKAGLSLLNGPGNDLVAITNLTAAGCHLILFTTGRGTPVGAPVPTIKIATNTMLAERKPHWIDFNAQADTIERLAGPFFRLILKTASGRKTKNERNNYREIAILKDGVTL